MRLRRPFLSLSKTLRISLQNSLCFSFSPCSSSKKWMERFSTSREPRGGRIPSDSGGSDSARKPSPSWSAASSNSSIVDHKDRSRELFMGSSNVGSLQADPENRPFDICRTEIKGPVKLNKSIYHQNKERKILLAKELEQAKHECLIPGMVLLRNFIGHSDQVKIVERCRELGTGEGGFYRPGYRDGAKLNLQMMCLGKNWDPDSRQYGDIRPSDGATPPKIPEEFRKLVDEAIQASHEFLRQNSRKPVNVEGELPMMSPDICIVNFYSKNGRLGLHQDRDESRKSIDGGLPVVSFSLGDDAEFLYGNGRDVDTAKKVVLKSGDVLLFGGKSRLLFHGVSTVLEDTAPSFLENEAKLKPGRLNLTFRQY